MAHLPSWLTHSLAQFRTPPKKRSDSMGSQTERLNQRTKHVRTPRRVDNVAPSPIPMGEGLNPPSGAVMVCDELIGIRAVERAQEFGIPFEFLSNAIGDIAEKRGFGERSGIVEVTGRWATG